METTINQVFARSADRFANRVVLIEPAESESMATVTFRELQEQADRFAGALQQQGYQKGDRVMIWSANRINWMVAYLGALLLGLVVVPLDINSRADFLARIAETTGAKALITTTRQYSSLKQPPLPLIDIEALPEGTLDTTALPEVTGEDLAELVFTSGTTGQPKGVMLTHNNIASNAIAAVSVVNILDTDRTLSILPLSHMFEMTIEVAVLYIGASVVYTKTLTPDTLLRLLSTQRVTCMVLVPQALQLFMNGIERTVRQQKRERQWEMLHRIASRLPFPLRRYLFAAVHKRFGGHFRFFVSGGAYLPPRLAARWENMGFRVMQGYGATECSPVVSVTPYNDHNYTSVGKPLPGVQVRIAEDKEILVHGPNVAKGYWKNEEATMAAFEHGWYHTGDLGYFDEKGDLYLKGRKKNLIVLANGLNVYPEDIENVLNANPLVKESVVFGLGERDEGPQVHAVLLTEKPEMAKEIVRQANKQLAPHQQIRSFSVWPEDEFPRTHTLKVKRQEVLAKLPEVRRDARLER
ncbi:MAG TPA: AMP-binding protein [Ktedonobacteraceae bacterium]|nr:AMP-binding protein [Ktedonobacteraceae bacterium]